MKDEAVDHNMWRDRFGRGFETVVKLLDIDDASTRSQIMFLALFIKVNTGTAF